MSRTDGGRGPRGVMVAGAIGLALVAGMVGAGVANDPEPTVVGITAIGEQGPVLIRIWSDGRMEQAYLVPGATPGRMDTGEWVPVETRGRRRD
ncbi:MAG: hypothetical protein R3B68_15525 [Phycisphaerales bacterium]